MDKIEDLLREFGLTEYEIKAFITLLKIGTATAEQISESGSIPLPRVYDTLVELKKKGFVLISKTRPKKFKSMSPERALDNLIKMKREDFDKGMKHLEENVKNIKNIVPEIESLNKLKESQKEEMFTLWSTEKRVNVINLMNDLVKSSKEEILYFAGDMSWFPESSESIKAAIKRGVEIKIIAREIGNTKEFLKNLSKAKKMGLKIKTGYNSILRGSVIDGEKVSLAIKTSEKGINVAEDGTPQTDVTRKYELVLIENSLIAKALKENFEFWWNELK